MEFCGDGIVESLGNGAMESNGVKVMDLGGSDGVMESVSE